VVTSLTEALVTCRVYRIQRIFCTDHVSKASSYQARAFVVVHASDPYILHNDKEYQMLFVGGANMCIINLCKAVTGLVTFSTCIVIYLILISRAGTPSVCGSDAVLCQITLTTS